MQRLGGAVCNARRVVRPRRACRGGNERTNETNPDTQFERLRYFEPSDEPRTPWNIIPYVLHDACGVPLCDTRLKHHRRESDRQESDVQPAPSKRQLAALVMRTTTTATRSSSSTRLAVACCARARRTRRLAIMRLAGGQPLVRVRGDIGEMYGGFRKW